MRKAEVEFFLVKGSQTGGEAETIFWCFEWIFNGFGVVMKRNMDPNCCYCFLIVMWGCWMTNHGVSCKKHPAPGTHKHGGPTTTGNGLPKQGYEDLSCLVCRKLNKSLV